VTRATAAVRPTITATTRATAVVTTHGSKSFVNRPFCYLSAPLASTRPATGMLRERKWKEQNVEDFVARLGRFRQAFLMGP
jgi:hypothetical protein